MDWRRADVSLGRPLQSASATHLQRGALIVARVAWGLAAALVLALFLASLPPYLAHLQTICLHPPCLAQQLTPRSAHALQDAGLTVATYAALAAALTLGAAVVWLLLGGLLLWRRSDDGMAVLVAFLLVVGGASNGLNPSSAPSPVSGTTPANLLTFLFSVAIVVVFALFPSGRFVPHWARWLIPAFLLNSVPYTLFPGWYARLPGWISALGLLDFVGCILLLVLAQVYRYRRVSTALQRQQTRWILVTFGAGVALLLGGSLLERLIPSLAGSLYDPVLASVNALGSLLFPLALVVAILRYRLWDIDLLINRTLVYGALTASVAGLYILVVGYLGALFRTGGNLLVSLLATGIVAVLFQPLRGWLQRSVNRLLYGQRDEPYAVVARLGRRLESALAPEAVLPTMVDTVAQALKLPYVAILLQRGAEAETAAIYGTPVDQPVVLPLTYHSEVVGQLALGPRRRGDAFSPADQRLLEDLARQLAPAAHAVRLSADLQRSRERVVTAREEERRRLRRDLHDGLGPALGSLILQLDTARALLTRDPAAGDALLVDLKGQVQAALDDIRRLVYALRPPTLDDLGLVSALREQVARCHQPGLAITLHAPAPLPALPAAIEGALYRIAQEALTNVVRHAGASTCVVSLDVTHEARLEVRDDGRGLPAHWRTGVGMAAMRERAAELGGTCLIEPGVGGGTRVVVRLPLPPVSQEEADGHTAGPAAARANC
ncbi:MAG TPA: histidine kinase [Chloroflexota bacterium]|nr:histidine kinase [Chloroflexota bacterium]